MKKSIIQFIKFGIIGGMNTVLSLLIYWCGIYLGVHYFLANTIGFVITVCISYVLNNLFTFRDKAEKVSWSFAALIKVFVSYSITGFFLNNILLYISIDLLKISEVVAPVINLFFTIPTNFVLNKFWAYKDTKSKKSDIA